MIRVTYQGLEIETDRDGIVPLLNWIEMDERRRTRERLLPDLEMTRADAVRIAQAATKASR